MSATFTASVSASDAKDAVKRAHRQVAKLDGFELTGRVQVKSERHLLWNVEIHNNGGDVNDAWVVLTSYGINPSPELGSDWESVLGATAS